MKKKSIIKKILLALIFSSLLSPCVMTFALPSENTLYLSGSSTLESGKINLIINEIYKEGHNLVIDCYILNDTSTSYNKLENLNIILNDKNNKKVVDANFNSIDFENALAPYSLVREKLLLPSDTFNLDGANFSSIHIKWNSNPV